ncbi:gluconokinase [Leucothrix arctica]|uniref:Gluconokinase n=2 Tax=Leucothrix arctica TaxID=1481894 RepID=A0A317C9H4_9GAMM|nr:gluconokinase [Leucothrix arctica]
MEVSQPASNTPKLLIVMGVSGSGKSTIAEHLATALNAIFLDADDYHPQNNIDKMSRGDALTDDDRWPWLKTFGETMAEQTTVCVGACSALKRVYRTRLTESAKEPILFVYLDGDKALLMERMSGRKDHFMPTTLLESQLATLETPDADEYAISVDINGSPEVIISRIKQQIEELNNDK